MSDVYVQVKGNYLRLSEDGQTIEVSPTQEEASQFPQDVADQIVAALKSEGIDEGVEQLPVENAAQ